MVAIGLNATTVKGNSRQITILAPATCKEWITARNEETSVSIANFSMSRQYRQFWLLGLITGLNAKDTNTKNLLASVNSDLVFDWMDKYCTTNPQNDVFEGAESLLDEISKRL